MKKTVFFSLVLLMFAGFTNNLAVETETWVLTPEERSLINEVYNAGIYDEEAWARFFLRVRCSPRREDAIKNALLDEGLPVRLSRELHCILVSIFDPFIGLKSTDKHFSTYGFVGGLLYISVMPLENLFTNRMGLGDFPLATLVSLIPIETLRLKAIKTPEFFQYLPRR